MRLIYLASKYLTPTNVRAARIAVILAAGLMALHGIHVPHVFADDDSGGS